jgi:exopolyphosphatase/pppGpp-phosphohydrolase
LKLNTKLLPKGHIKTAIGTGGNLDAMAKLKLVILKKGPNTLITFEELEKMYTIFSKTPQAKRAQTFGLKPDRVDVIEPAMFLTLSLMKKYEIKKLKIPGTGLKEGAILSLLQ